MTSLRTYLVALTAWTAYHAHITAHSEDEAIAEAAKRYTEDASAFTPKDGGIEAIQVVSSQAIA